MDPVERLAQLRFVPVLELVEGIAAFVALAMKPSRYLVACFYDFIFVNFEAVLLWRTPYPLDPRSCRFSRTFGIQAMRP